MTESSKTQETEGPKVFLRFLDSPISNISRRLVYVAKNRFSTKTSLENA